MYDIIQLSLSDPTQALQPFATLIPSDFQAKPFTTKKLGFAALLQGHPVGLILASCTPAFPITEKLFPDIQETQQLIVDVEHLFVAAEHRGKHVGRLLLSALQTAAESIGGYYFSLTYPLNTTETGAFEKVVAACGWEGKRPFLLHCRFDSFTFGSPYARKLHRYPPGFEEFLWSNLTPQEHADLLARQKQGGLGSVAPLVDEDKIEYINSLGLRYEGRVVGWMVNHRVAADTICYKYLYVEPGLEFHALAPKLIFNAVYRHMHAHVQWAILDIPLIQVKATWKHFVERRLVPFAIDVSRQMQAWHIKRL